MFLNRTTSDRCPACGAAHAACGPPSDTVPVDAQIGVATVGGPLGKYRYTSGTGHQTVLKLNDEDAARLGLTEADLADATSEPEPEPAPEVKARTASTNKGRGGSANKGTPTGRSRARKSAAKPPAAGRAEQTGPDPAAADPGDSGQTSADSGDSGNGGSGGGD